MSKTIKSKIEKLEARTHSGLKEPGWAEQAKKASGFLVDLSRLPEGLTEEQREAEEERLVQKYGFKTNAEGVVVLI